MKQIIFFFCIIFLLIGCKGENEPGNDLEMNKYVNEWVYENMEMLYYWNTSLPAYKSTSANPNEYFKTLKHADDRFSAIFEDYQKIKNELNGVSSAEAGFEFQLFRESGSNNNVLGVVAYIKPGTPAATLGIRRGDVFRKINGKQMTMDNYREVINYLFDETPVVQVAFAEQSNEVYMDKEAVSISKVANYQEDPVYMDTVFTIRDKKIGYLVYNFFTNGPTDNSLVYDLRLNDVMSRFKQENISEMIVDFRYNSGGMMSSALRLASMLVPNPTADKVFAYTQYNRNYTDYFNSSAYKSKYSDNPFVSNFTTTISTSTPVLNVGGNLQRIYFLTGKRTASASEMVINGLKPYLPCVLIGDTTVGKNVGSTLVNDTKNTKNQWAFMPIVLKYFNKDHASDFTRGFAPDYFMKDDFNYMLGDTREGLLGKAISLITGVPQSAPAVSPTRPELRRQPIRFNTRPDVLIVEGAPVEGLLKQNAQ